MDEMPLPKLVSRALVAKSMGKSLRWFNATVKEDPNFPKPVRIRNRYFYLYDDYMDWLKANIRGI